MHAANVINHSTRERVPLIENQPTQRFFCCNFSLVDVAMNKTPTCTASTSHNLVATHSVGDNRCYLPSSNAHVLQSKHHPSSHPPPPSPPGRHQRCRLAGAPPSECWQQSKRTMPEMKPGHPHESCSLSLPVRGRKIQRLSSVLSIEEAFRRFAPRLSDGRMLVSSQKNSSSQGSFTNTRFKPSPDLESTVCSTMMLLWTLMRNSRDIGTRGSSL
jgi:hypothetical protein